MVRRLSIAAFLAASALAAPAYALNDAVAGATHLRELNLIVFDDMSLTSEVEGKAFIGGDLLAGSSGNFGIGSAASGNTQGQATTGGHPILFVGGNNLAGFNSIHVKNGSNGPSGKLSTTGSSAGIRGNSHAIELQDGDRSWTVGGNLLNAGNFPIKNMRLGGNVLDGNLGGVSGGTIEYGASSSRINFNGATAISNPALASTIAAEVAAKVTDVVSDVKALSTQLAGMTVLNPSAFNIAGDNLTLTAVDGGEGFALFNLDGNALAGLQHIFFSSPSDLTVVINITGLNATPFNWDMTVNSGDKLWMNQNVIWNFVDAQKLTINDEFHGTLLAPLADVTAFSQMNGTVVANVFHGNAEVHLGAYNGIKTFTPPPPPPPAVPEPATWAMMIGGLGMVGASMRRRAKVAFA